MDFRNSRMTTPTAKPSDDFRVIITGAGGFVGSPLIAALRRLLPINSELLGTTRDTTDCDDNQTLDVTDSTAVSEVIAKFQPTHIVHLAALSAISDAEQHSRSAWDVNLIGTLNVADAIMRHCPEACLISISSAQVYGFTANVENILTEDSIVKPANIYGVTKASSDLALIQMATKGLKTIILRPFNHTGPSQEEAFAIPSFAAQIARIEAGIQLPVIKVGTLDSSRDFLDVRDVADAYSLAVTKSNEIASGTIINIASGKPHRMGEILDKLISMSNVSIEIEYDVARSRPNDIPNFAGDTGRAKALLGWHAKYDFDDTLKDVLNYFRQEYKKQT